MLQLTAFPWEHRLLTLKEICRGDPDATPPVPPIVPCSEPAFCRAVELGLYPKPVQVSEGLKGWHGHELAAAIRGLPPHAASPGRRKSPGRRRNPIDVAAEHRRTQRAPRAPAGA